MHMVSAADRRRQTRFKATLAVTDGRRATTTRDISPDGIFVRGLGYHVGDRVSLLVQFPDGSVPFRVAAEVVRADKLLGGVGLRLVHASDPHRMSFSAAIVRLVPARAHPRLGEVRLRALRDRLCQQGTRAQSHRGRSLR